MVTLKMHKLINKWGPQVFISFLIILFLHFLRKFLRFVIKEDGWRKTTRIYLRTEESKFILACFRLILWSQEEAIEYTDLNSKKNQVIKRLGDFFQQQPKVHWQLQWSRFSARRIKKDKIDIVHAEFDENGSLKSIIPYLNLSGNDIKLDNIMDKLKANLIQGIVEIYNRTKDLDDKVRPWILKKQLNKWILTQLRGTTQKVRKQANYYIERILSATFIHFEEAILDYGRFDPPVFIKRKHPGFGFLNIVCRLSNKNGELDLWVQCSHICEDGVPMQEVLQELKAKWGISGNLKFPPLSYGKEIIPEQCSTKDDRNGVYSVSQFVNFYPFLKMVKEKNKEYAKRIKMTPFRLFIWRLANHPTFRYKKFLVPVDLHRCHNHQRTLGFVVIRPSIYFDKNSPENGFFKFDQEFERQVKTALAHRAERYELFESYALLPPLLYAIALKLLPLALKELSGSIGISVINKAEAFIAPYSDVQTDGFMALNSFFTPTEDGNRACYISIKGPKDKLKDYIMAISQIIRIHRH